MRARPITVPAVLIGMMCTGTGVGLTFPTVMSIGISALPPSAPAVVPTLLFPRRAGMEPRLKPATAR